MLVDLLTVVRQSMRVGVESYSLKQIEALAGFVRSADMGSGADAVLGYERYVETDDPAELDGIARYNDEDCRATLALRDWLVSVRPADAERLAPVPHKDLATETPKRRRRARRSASTGHRRRAGQRRWLAGELLEYHRREARPGWWRWFSMIDMDERGADRGRRGDRRTRARRTAAGAVATRCSR